MKFLGGAARWLGAYALAALVGYAIAILGITTHNLLRLGALGIHIGLADAWKTLVFDFKGLSPTFGTITKYGSVLCLGYLIAFPVGQGLIALATRKWRHPHLDLALFALAGITAVIVGIAIIDAQYKVSMISGTGGVTGYLTQLLAGAVAGLVFALSWRSTGGRSA